MTMARLLIALVAPWLALPALATPQQYDASDLWIKPDESGWGLNVFHQGNTLFTSLFVYGPDGRSRWYTGSSITGDDGGPNHDRAPIYSGVLVESTGGAGIGATFDPSRVTRREVGTLLMELRTQADGARTAELAYNIEGTHVFKTIVPFTFAGTGLTGTYIGYQSSPETGVRDEMTINVTLDGASFAMATTGSASGSCTYSGTRRANGSLNTVTGTYSCNDGRTGPFSMRDIDVTPHGFTAKFNGNRVPAGTFYGAMGGARTSANVRGTGWQTDLWWNPAESGWGLNIIEQGNNLFGTLFVYDSAGQPRWYSASDLTYNPARSPPPDCACDSHGVYTGALYESTGPYFGTSFNPAAVTRREVGTIRFEVVGNRSGLVTYTIDGVTVANKLLDRATFRMESMAGNYVGHILGEGNNRGVQAGAMTFDVTESGDAVTMVMRGAKGQCTMRDARGGQYGHQRMPAGSYDCGGAVLGSLWLDDIQVSWAGFTGRVSLDGYPIGRIAAVRTTAH